MSDSSSAPSTAGGRLVTIGFQAEGGLDSNSSLSLSADASLEFEFLNDNEDASNDQEAKKGDAQPDMSKDQVTERGDEQPVVSNDQVAEKGDAQPEVSRNQEAEKGDAQPEVSRNQEAEKDDAQPEVSRNQEAEKGDAQPEVSRNQEAEKDDAQPEVSRNQEAEKGDAQPEVSRNQEAEMGDAQPEVSRNQEAEKGDAQPEVSRSHEDEKGDAQPEVSNDQVADKDDAQPEVSKDQEADKDDAQPDVSKDQEPTNDYKPSDQSKDQAAAAKVESKSCVSTDQAAKRDGDDGSPTEHHSRQEAVQSRVEAKGDTRKEPAIDSGKPDASDSHNQPASRGLRILGVEFAPLNTPMRRRLQTLAVLQWLLSIAILPVVCVVLMAVLLFTPLAPFVLVYIGWVLIFDRKTSQRGGRRWDRLRQWSLWRHYRDYFPISLVKSADLDPSHNYLIGYHPHGIISCGAFCNFGTEATGFSAKFPGIKPYLLTLRVNFFWPLLRRYYMAAGLCDVSRPSIQWILSRPGGGNAAIIVVGGAQEALDARPGNYCLTLLRRKGFARMALQTGAHLVPCFSFGENDLFRQASNPPGSRVRAFQQLFKGTLGSSPPLFYGRGVFNYNFGLLPFRHEVITVVGAAIPVEQCAQPSQEQVDDLHQRYMAQLADLFDQHKGRYGVPDDVRLEFV